MYKDDKRVKGECHNGDHHGYILVTVDGSKVTIVWKAMAKESSVTAWGGPRFLYLCSSRFAKLMSVPSYGVYLKRQGSRTSAKMLVKADDSNDGAK